MPGLFSSGDTTINYPNQPSYSEALSESLKAQTDLLRGTGEFADTGGLQSLVEQFEAPLRQSTAQIDTDVLRQTLLGTQQKVVRDPETGQFGIPGAEVVTGEDGKPQTAGGGRYQIVMQRPSTSAPVGCSRPSRTTRTGDRL